MRAGFESTCDEVGVGRQASSGTEMVDSGRESKERKKSEVFIVEYIYTYA